MATLPGAARLSAQCEPLMNLSVYADGDVSDDGSTVYGWSSASDHSTLCTCIHSDYETYAILELHSSGTGSPSKPYKEFDRQ